MTNAFADIESTFRIICSFEGARALSLEARDHLDAMNHWVRAAQDMARSITEAHYDAAHAHASRCRHSLAQTMAGCDVLLTPSTCGEAPADLEGVSNSAFNRIWTLMHVPCVSIPAYTGPNGMPVGIQVVGPIGSDARTLAVAEAIAAVV